MKRERLVSERTKRKKTRADVAYDLNISEIYVRKIESGVVDPGLKTVRKFSEYFEIGEKTLFPDLFFKPNDKKLIKTGTE